MKTVLHTIETTGPGGAETVFTQLATQPASDEFRHVAAIAGPGWVEDTLRSAGLEPLRVHIASTRPPFDWALYRGLVDLIREHRVDLVQSHTLGMSVYACLAGARTRTRVVCTLHGDTDLGRSDRRRGIKLGILRFGASSVVTVSNYLREQLLRESRIPERRATVIHNGVDVERHADTTRDRTLRDEFAIRDNELLFGAVGNVRAPKAYDDLLRAAAIAIQAAPSLRFVVVGEGSGPLLDGLLRLRTELGLERVFHFAGFRSDVPRVLRNFDAFVLASRSEGFSIATVQAMASGLPLIATRSGGPDEIVTSERDGLLVEPANPAVLAAAMVRLAADARLRAALGQAARTTARSRFSLSRMLDAYAALHRHVLGLPSPLTSLPPASSGRPSTASGRA